MQRLVSVTTICAGTAAALAGTVLLVVQAARLGRPALDAAGRAAAGPAPVLLLLATVVTALVVARLALTGLLALLAAAGQRGAAVDGRPGRCTRAALRVAPRVLRPGVAGLLGLGLAVGVASPASAAPAADRQASSMVTATATLAPTTATPESAGAPTLPDPGWAEGPAASARAPVPGWLPPRPARSAARLPDPALVVAAQVRPAPPGRGEVATVVVHRDDSLWSIAARHLGAGASDVEIAHAWPLWWRANRAVVGPDPNRLLPGTRLLVPGPTGAPR